jgi:uncharacterized damage-inducible protein DinB
MITADTAVTLARYNEWADRVLFEAIRALPGDAASKPASTLFGSMIGALNHNYQVDLIWRAHLSGEKHGFTSRRDILHPDLGALAKAQLDVDQWFIDWAGRQDPGSFAERVRFNFISGKPGEMTRGGMFLHVINHKTYHRGWVSQMFFDHGAKPPETDLCVFLCAS